MLEMAEKAKAAAPLVAGGKGFFFTFQFCQIPVFDIGLCISLSSPFYHYYL
jgi:hypothetical protein